MSWDARPKDMLYQERPFTELDLVICLEPRRDLFLVTFTPRDM